MPLTVHGQRSEGFSAESDRMHKITVRLANEGRETLTEEISLSAGDTIYAFLKNAETNTAAEQ